MTEEGKIYGWGKSLLWYNYYYHKSPKLIETAFGNKKILDLAINGKKHFAYLDDGTWVSLNDDA